MFYVWLCNSWPGIVINFSTIHFSPVWIQIPFTFGSRQRRTSRCACACLRVSSKRRCSSGWWQTISALESRVSLLYWKASCMHPLTLRPAPGSSKMTKGLFPGKVAFILVFYRTVVVHYIYNPNPNPLTLTLALKRILLTLKTLHHLAPSYLSDLLIPHCPSRALRSSSTLTLTIPPSRLKTFGDRAFFRTAPRLWNSLPQPVRYSPSLTTFKSRLKTYLFSQAYDLPYP